MNGSGAPDEEGQQRHKPAVRVTKIEVEGLFGIFHHEIPPDRAERVTIIHGPNGYGKTVVLRMIAALGRGPKSIFEHTASTEFRVTLEDRTERIVRRRSIRKVEDGGSAVALDFLIRDANGTIILDSKPRRLSQPRFDKWQTGRNRGGGPNSSTTPLPPRRLETKPQTRLPG